MVVSTLIAKPTVQPQHSFQCVQGGVEPPWYDVRCPETESDEYSEMFDSGQSVINWLMFVRYSLRFVFDVHANRCSQDCFDGTVNGMIDEGGSWCLEPETDSKLAEFWGCRDSSDRRQDVRVRAVVETRRLIEDTLV